MSEVDSLTLQDLLGEKLYIELDETRSLVGLVKAIDCKANLLLDDVLEKVDGHERKLGLVSVPFASVKNIRMKKVTIERKDKLSGDIV